MFVRILYFYIIQKYTLFYIVHNVDCWEYWELYKYTQFTRVRHVFARSCQQQKKNVSAR